MDKIIQLDQTAKFKKKISGNLYNKIASYASYLAFAFSVVGTTAFHRLGFSPILTLVIFGVMLGGGFATVASQAQAAQLPAPPNNVPPEGPTDYANCVQIALKQSPYFLKTSLDLEISGLDETDSRWGMVPSFSVGSRYFLARPSSPYRYPRAYTVEFATDNYNPFRSYINLQVYKLATQMAVLNHMSTIRAGLGQMASGFIQLDILNQIIGHQEELINLSRQNLSYFQNRQRSGTVSTLEVQVAAQEVEMSLFERQKVLASQKTVREGLLAFLGYPLTEKVNFDIREGHRQVLENFDPNAATLEQAQANSFEVKMTALKAQIQEKNVKLAYTKYIPDIYATISSPDPTGANLGSGVYFAIGLRLPIWDGFKRHRNVSRQEKILKQLVGRTQDASSTVNKEWNKIQDKFKENASALKLAQGQEELARMKDRQSEIRHRVGGEPFTVLVEGRRKFLEAKIKTAEKKLDYESSILDLRTLSGDLFNAYIDVNYQKLKGLSSDL